MSPYSNNGATSSRAVPGKIESDEPQPLHDTDPQSLAPVGEDERPTDPETPMSIETRLQNLDRRMALLEQGQRSIVNELCRHKSVERGARVAHGSLPWAALLVALAALAVSVYRMGEPATITVESIPAQGAVFQ